MKLLFSEYRSDYDHYIFPYAVWAFPEDGESPAQFFARGFLPSSRDLSRFYLCRSVRVRLKDFKPTSENRRILRKGEGITSRLVSRSEFAYTPEKRAAFKIYADIRFGKDVLSFEKLDNLFTSPITSHLLVFSDAASGREIGVVTLYLEKPAFAYYYHAFYELEYFPRNIGMFMMTRAVEAFRDLGFEFIYLGSCYSRNALYKSQFPGAEFFNGVRWSNNLKELKHLIRREDQPVTAHLLETASYREEFWASAAPSQIAAQGLSVPLVA